MTTVDPTLRQKANNYLRVVATIPPKPTQPLATQQQLPPLIHVAPIILGHYLEVAWNLYRELFEPLNALAVQRHLLNRSEFQHLMTNPRVDKYLCIDPDGELRGISTLTNHLRAVPLISSAYFRRRWPREYAEHRIYYVSFVAVRPNGHEVSAFRHLVTAMQRVVEADQGVVGLDMCVHSDEVLHMSTAVRLLVRRLHPAANIERADQQS